MSKVVIYHNNCYDGVTAAWVAYKALDPAFEGMSSDVEYFPVNYSDPPPDVKDKEVYILDFSFKRDILEALKKEAKSLVVLDHHKTAQEALADLDYATFDMNKSGAGLAWDYFFPNSPRPNLVNYVEDRDLWRFALPDSKKVNAFIQSWDINLETWIFNVGPSFIYRSLEEIVKEGESLLRLEDKYIKQICANAKLQEIHCPDRRIYTGPYVQTSILMSEVCSFLIEEFKTDFSFYSFDRKDGKTQYGLRSRGDFDVSVIAKSFGGGGHKNAAGFEVDKPLF